MGDPYTPAQNDAQNVGAPLLQQVCAAIHVLYNQPNDPKQFSEANEWLLRFQSSDAAWSVVSALLEEATEKFSTGTADASTMQRSFFASHTLASKLAKNFSEIPRENYAGVKDAMVKYIAGFSHLTLPSGAITKEARVILRQLCAGYADYLVQFPTENSKSFFADALRQLQETFPLPQGIFPIVEVFRLIVEKCDRGIPNRNRAHRNILFNAIEALAGDFFQLLGNYFRTCVQSNDMETIASIFECFGVWVSVLRLPEDLTIQSNFIPLLAEGALLESDLTKVCISVLYDVLSTYRELRPRSPLLVQLQQSILALRSLFKAKVEAAIQAAKEAAKAADDSEGADIFDEDEESEELALLITRLFADAASIFVLNSYYQLEQEFMAVQEEAREYEPTLPPSAFRFQETLQTLVDQTLPWLECILYTLQYPSPVVTEGAALFWGEALDVLRPLDSRYKSSAFATEQWVHQFRMGFEEYLHSVQLNLPSSVRPLDILGYIRDRCAPLVIPALPILVDRLSFPKRHIWNSYSNDKRMAFKHKLRYDILDVLQGMGMIAGGEKLLMELANILQSALAKNPAATATVANASTQSLSDWEHIEATLYAIRGIATLLDASEAQVLPALMEFLISAQYLQPAARQHRPLRTAPTTTNDSLSLATLNSLLNHVFCLPNAPNIVQFFPTLHTCHQDELRATYNRLFGRYAFWLRHHPRFLQQCLRFLFLHNFPPFENDQKAPPRTIRPSIQLSNPALFNAASAVKQLCHVAPSAYTPQLLNDFQSVHTLNMHPEVSEPLIQALSVLSVRHFVLFRALPDVFTNRLQTLLDLLRSLIHQPYPTVCALADIGTFAANLTRGDGICTPESAEPWGLSTALAGQLLEFAEQQGGSLASLFEPQNLRYESGRTDVPGLNEDCIGWVVQIGSTAVRLQRIWMALVQTLVYQVMVFLESVQFADDETVEFVQRALKSPEGLKQSFQNEADFSQDLTVLIDEIAMRHGTQNVTVVSVLEAQQQYLGYCKSQCMQLLLDLKQHVLTLQIDLEARHDTLFFIRRCFAVFYHHAGVTPEAFQIYESVLSGLESFLTSADPNDLLHAEYALPLLEELNHIVKSIDVAFKDRSDRCRQYADRRPNTNSHNAMAVAPRLQGWLPIDTNAIDLGKLTHRVSRILEQYAHMILVSIHSSIAAPHSTTYPTPLPVLSELLHLLQANMHVISQRYQQVLRALSRLCLSLLELAPDAVFAPTADSATGSIRAPAATGQSSTLTLLQTVIILVSLLGENAQWSQVLPFLNILVDVLTHGSWNSGQFSAFVERVYLFSTPAPANVSSGDRAIDILSLTQPVYLQTPSSTFGVDTIIPSTYKYALSHQGREGLRFIEQRCVRPYLHGIRAQLQPLAQLIRNVSSFSCSFFFNISYPASSFSITSSFLLF